MDVAPDGDEDEGIEEEEEYFGMVFLKNLSAWWNKSLKITVEAAVEAQWLLVIGFSNREDKAHLGF